MAATHGRALAAVFAGGMAGTLARVWLGRHFAGDAGDWPWATFAINISGSFALAYLATQLHERPPSSFIQPLLASGFCGAYTTFSTMQVETLRIIDRHGYGLAAGYAGASVAAGLAAIAAASSLARRRRVSW